MKKKDKILIQMFLAQINDFLTNKNGYISLLMWHFCGTEQRIVSSKYRECFGADSMTPM